MNKSELIDNAAEETGLSKTDVEKVLRAILGSIEDSVKRGEKVAISGFGTFERRERAARTGRNPQTGETMQVAASKAPAFKPGKQFKDAVNI